MGGDQQQKKMWRWLIIVAIILAIGALLSQFPWDCSHRAATGIPRSYAPHGDELRAADGRVDYCATLNQCLASSEPPTENAVVDYLLFTGNRLLGDIEYRQAFLKTLNMSEADFSRVTPFSRTFGECYTQGTPELEVATVPWRGDHEYPKFAAWLDQQPEAAGKIRAATLKPYYHPLLGKADPTSGTASMNALLPVVSELRNLASILQVESMRELGKGQTEIPVSNAIAIRNMSWQLNDSLTLIEKLVANSLLGKSQDLCLELLKSGKLNRDQLDQLSISLQLRESELHIAKSMDRAERYMVLDALQAADWDGIDFRQYSSLVQVRGQAPKSPGFGWWGVRRMVDWGATLETVNTWIDQQVDAIATMETAGDYSNLESLGITPEFSSGNSIQETLNSMSSPEFRGQRQAEELLSLILPPSKSTLVVSAFHRQRQQLILAAIAVEKFRLDTGQYPDSLGQLVPEYLTSIPQDAFSPQQMVLFATDGQSYRLVATGRPVGAQPNQESMYKIEIPLRKDD